MKTLFLIRNLQIFFIVPVTNIWPKQVDSGVKQVKKSEEYHENCHFKLALPHIS